MKYKNNRRILLWVVCCMTEILKCLGQKVDRIDCLNDELVTSIFNDPIDLTLRGIIKVFGNVTINEILSTTNNEFEQNYIDARLENSNTNESKNLVLFTTQRFENYAREQTAARISLKINLGCGMGKERVVIFFQPLKDGNYFSPIFSQTHYELIVPTPIFAGFDLTAFLEITANDDDLTHNQISFTSNDSLQYYIRVGTKNLTSSDRKTYFANLTLERILLELPQAIEFEIVATDNGIPPKSSKASVKISSDPKRSLPAKPKFLQTLYKGYINVDFKMEPIKMQLSNGTYTPEVNYSLDGADVEDFRLQDNKNGSIEIIWNPIDKNKSQILNRRIWEFNVRAEHRSLADYGLANVLVEIADIKNNFYFVSSYYEGNIDEMGELHISPIIFNPFMYQQDMEFSLQSSYDFFYLSRQNFSIQVQLNENFTWQVIDGMGFAKLTLQAEWENLTSRTNIVIKMPQIKNKTLRQMFQFEKPLYVGQLNETNHVELETIVLVTNISQTEEIDLKLSGNDADMFFVIQNGTNIQIKAIFDLLPKENLKLKRSFLLVLQAKYHDITTFASVVINVAEINRIIERKIFVKPLVKGDLMIQNASQQLSIEPISVADNLEIQFNDLKFHLRGEHSLHFEIEKNFTNTKIVIALKTPLSTQILATKQLLNMTLQANIDGENGFNDTLLVFIELPIKECSLPARPLPDPPEFSSNNYVFTVYTNQTGILGVVNAFVKGVNATLHYSLEVQNDSLAQRLSINPFSGELFLYGTIEEGNYLFNITAENYETRDRTVAKALLKAQQQEECKMFEGVAVETSLMILHVDEEKPNYGLLNMKFNENCTFQIEDMWPNDKEYVNVNFLFNMLDAIAIDREDEVFLNMSEPQIVVKLRLKCDIESYQSNLTIEVNMPEVSRSSQISLTKDIPYSPDVMWLYIIIDDINDNAPEFKISEGPIFLGYPSGETDFDLYPEYLTQIEATDKDVGYNAEILYAIKNNSHFAIEPKTGRIYPKGKALRENEQTELILMAIDQNGNGLISRTVVVVNGLSPDFYSLITLKENSAKTREQVENSLSKKFGYEINILKMSYMPEEDEEVQQRTGNMDQNFSCKAWIYAYKKQKLVTCKEIQEQILVKNPDFSVQNIESYNEAVAIHSPPIQSSNLVYLIATILLSLLSCSSLVFIIWRFCYQSTLTTKCDTKTSSLAATHNGNGQQRRIHAECSHGFEHVIDCSECNNRDNNHVKFSDLVENGIEDESQLK